MEKHIRSLSGYISLAGIEGFHQELNYQLHPDPLTGFNFVDPLDRDRYTTDQLNVYISRDIDDVTKQFFVKQFEWILTDPAFSIQKLAPGMLLPMHTDQYGFYRQSNNVTEIDDIVRIIVFLEPWQNGHISEINQTSNFNWHAGSWYGWRGATPHMAANLGQTDRYTLQITGISK